MNHLGSFFYRRKTDIYAYLTHGGGVCNAVQICQLIILISLFVTARPVRQTLWFPLPSKSTFLFSTFLFLPTLNQIQEDWGGGENPDGLFQPGPSHPRPDHPSEKVRGSSIKAGSGEGSREILSSSSAQRIRPAAAWPRLAEKSADLQLLCRFHFLISNLRQPPRNNMADPSLRDRGRAAGDASARGAAAPSAPARRGGSHAARVEVGVEVRADVAGGTEEEKKSAEDYSRKKKRWARASLGRSVSKAGLVRPLLVAGRYCSRRRCMWVRHKRQAHEEDLIWALI